ncbi:MAG: type II secretion system protein [Clostridium sp.]|nr:type II secretion system protein [Clostridium sp.]
MKKKSAFSLAEALITLLIVSIIAIVSAPVLTKKAQKRPQEQPWLTSGIYNDALYPAGHRDIILGEVSSKHPQSIIVSGKLEFKNRAGQTIGWIAEDGSSSFAQSGNETYSSGVDYNLIMENQRKIMELLNSLQLIMNNQTNGQKRVSSSTSPAVSEEELQRQLDSLIKSMNSNVYGK